MTGFFTVDAALTCDIQTQGSCFIFLCPGKYCSVLIGGNIINLLRCSGKRIQEEHFVYFASGNPCIEYGAAGKIGINFISRCASTFSPESGEIFLKGIICHQDILFPGCGLLRRDGRSGFCLQLLRWLFRAATEQNESKDSNYHKNGSGNNC